MVSLLSYNAAVIMMLNQGEAQWRQVTLHPLFQSV
jgi:hypothetical protein